MTLSRPRGEDDFSWIVFSVVVVLGILTACILYHLGKFSLVYYGDAVSHEVGARRLVDWRDPGLQQLGTVWLPIPHFLLLPFVLIDFLFTSGFAGVAVSLPSLAMTSLILYKLAKFGTDQVLAIVPLAVAFLHASNPNILYMGLMPMTESPFLLFFVASAYFFERWREQPQHLKSLAACSVFVVLATMSRYEGWILPVFLVPFSVALLLRSELTRRDKIRGSIMAVASGGGILLWIAYNALHYGNPLEFANAEYYSAASQALQRPNRAALYLHPLNVLSMYGMMASRIFGSLLLVAGAAGGVVLCATKEARRRLPLCIMLALPPSFTVVSLFFGVAEMSEWFNSRYLILLSPLLVSLTAILFNSFRVARAQRYRWAVVVCIVVLFVYPWSLPLKGTVTTYNEGLSGFKYKMNPLAVQTGEVLRSVYDGGHIIIMTGSAQEHRIMLTSGIHLNVFDEMIESSGWKQSSEQPWLYGRWMVIGKEPDSDGMPVVEYWKGKMNELERHYRKVFENEYYTILVLR